VSTYVHTKGMAAGDRFEESITCKAAMIASHPNPLVHSWAKLRLRAEPQKEIEIAWISGLRGISLMKPFT